MKLTGGDIVVRALEDEQVPFAFGIPGTHNIELYDALATSKSVRPVLVTDEQSASFMADGVSRSSGKLGAVNVVPGAGLTHALSGIAEAYLDCTPMLVLGCGIRRRSGKGYQLHDIDQMAMVRPVTKAQFRADNAADLYATVRRACHIARRAPGGPVFVEVPADHYLFRHDVELAFDESTADSHLVVANNAERVPGAPSDREVLLQVRDMLAGARRPLLYLGLGALGAGADLVKLAERLESPVATSIQGKGVFPENHPLWLWCGFGDAAPPFVQRTAENCDMTLAIGCRFAEVGTGSYGVRPPGPLVHVDIDPAVPGRNYPAERTLVSDAAVFVRTLLELLPGRGADAALRETIRKGHEAVWQDLLDAGSAAESAGGRVSPPHLLRTLQSVFGSEAAYTTDSGNGTFLAMESLRLDRPRSFLAPVDYSCMGYALPAALGAALACPDRPVIALAGDGAFLMTGLELLTAAHLGIPVIVLVLRDGELAQIAQFQQTALSRKTCSELPQYDVASLCQAVGVRCISLARNADTETALRQAREAATDGPIVLDVAIDYSRKTYFTRGVVRTNFHRLPWSDRVRFVTRALARRLGVSRA